MRLLLHIWLLSCLSAASSLIAEDLTSNLLILTAKLEGILEEFERTRSSYDSVLDRERQAAKQRLKRRKGKGLNSGGASEKTNDGDNFCLLVLHCTQLCRTMTAMLLS